jgi:hypothetical protein
MSFALVGALLLLSHDETASWSLAPVADPAVPAVKDEAWPVDDLDRFVLARLEAAGLAPGEDATPSVLLRRLCFDLTGLPPAPAQLEALEADPGGYEALVDELLASPRFAERWGRHWLDVARFAESSGGGRSLMFPDAWRFRDYVIDSVEQDVPFDRFVLEQLAGDLLPAETPTSRNRQRTATAFLLLGPTNYEQQDKELLRLDVIDEQIDTVGRAFLGQTFGCARCHDHKFDPVTHEDYYALAGIFASTQVLTPGNVSGWTEVELEGEATSRWHAHRAEVLAVEAELAALKGGRSDLRSIDRSALETGLIFDDAEATLIGSWKRSTSVAGYLDVGYLHDENLEKGDKSVTWTPDLPSAGRYQVRLAYTPGSNRASNTPVTIEHALGRAEVRVDQRNPPPLQGWFVALGTWEFQPGMTAVVTIGTAGTDGHVIADGLWLVPEGEVEAGAQAEAITAEVVRAQVRLESRLAVLKKDAPPAAPVTMAAREAATPRDEPLHLRGSARDLADPVPRRAPTFCALPPGVIPAGTSGRLELARWIVHPENPLTARVRVNRVWGHLFGAGLVQTPDNFGAMGQRPSHPALLDRLARDHVADGWSTKRLVRRLVLSRTYRLAVGEAPANDPENRLRAVSSRRRIDADALRDAMLAASGELDLTRGGRTLTKVTQYDYGYQHSGLRRSVYVPSLRNSVLDLFAVFDGPNLNLVTGQRGESQVPTQALLLMNSPWVRARAEALARRVLDHDGDPLALACALTVGRPPTAHERRLLRAEDLDGWTGIAHALLASIDFRYL